jgi:hypothetical protein
MCTTAAVAATPTAAVVIAHEDIHVTVVAALVCVYCSSTTTAATVAASSVDASCDGTADLLCTDACLMRNLRAHTHKEVSIPSLISLQLALLLNISVSRTKAAVHYYLAVPSTVSKRKYSTNSIALQYELVSKHIECLWNASSIMMMY